MRFLLISVLAVVLATTIQAEVFKKEKVTLGKKKCVCDFDINDNGDKCTGKVKCDKKCTGSGTVELGGCSFTLKVKKGKGAISKCQCEAEPTGSGTGSGEGPVTILPPPGSGSGSEEQPVTILPPPGSGSGSGERPVPIPPTPGSGSGVPTQEGEGMQCSCKCNCPDGSGDCDCDCNCPMTSTALNCASGFSKVCPMMGEVCPEDMEQICPMNAENRMGDGNGYAAGTDKGCQCVPDFLMALVAPGMPPAAGRLGAVDRAMTKATIQVGNKKCKCSYEMNADNCKKSKIICDKKCSGKAQGVEVEDGMYVLDIAVKKGKVTIAKCDVQATETTGTGTGSGTGGGGMGSGSGNGGGGMGGMGSKCACVSKGMAGSGPPTGGSGPEPTPVPTGSGSGPEPTGSGSGPETTGSGSGPEPTGSGSGPEPTGSGSGSTPRPQTVTIPQRSWPYMTTKMTPTPGPLGETSYIPGTPGSPWTDDEALATRLRILQMIHPSWKVKKAQGTWNGVGTVTTMGQVTENTLMRLVFHDCVLYEDGTGGCDGCISWKGMHHAGPDPNNKDDYYGTEPIQETDNNGMDQIAEKLELIYTTIDWPFQNASLEISLQQSGKSRADLWELAGLVALERTIERANRACDLDFHARQQVTILESREKCEIKLTKPLKFLTGRSDCVSEDPEGRGYVASKPEQHPLMFGDANHVVDYGKNVFGIDAEHFTALQGIHGVVHAPANMGLKYTWFGPGYLSNMYFKMIANKKRYRFEVGGDLSFGVSNGSSNIVATAVGDQDGNPVAQNGWRASCMMAWNTTEGGPCFLRPTPATAFDSPNPDKMAFHACVEKVDSNGECVIDTRWGKRCENTWCDENHVEHGSKLAGVDPEIEGPWHENATDQRWRHAGGWNNQFAFPWEIGMYWNFTTGGVGQRAVGCPGLDTPFGSVDKPNWPHRNNKSPIFASPAMQCEVNTYAPEGKPLYQIVNDLAEDNEYFAEKFLEGWQQMTYNGYSPEQLVDGPQSGWLGYYSLTNQGVEITDFETYIQENAPVTFTDPKADPYICGHRGHAMVSCGSKFSTGFAANVFQGPGDEGPGF